MVKMAVKRGKDFAWPIIAALVGTSEFHSCRPFLLLVPFPLSIALHHILLLRLHKV